MCFTRNKQIEIQVSTLTTLQLTQILFALNPYKIKVRDGADFNTRHNPDTLQGHSLLHKKGENSLVPEFPATFSHRTKFPSNMFQKPYPLGAFPVYRQSERHCTSDRADRMVRAWGRHCRVVYLAQCALFCKPMRVK